LAFALVAMFLVAARPVCEAAGAKSGTLHAAMIAVLAHSVAGHAAPDGTDASACCASVEGGALVKVAKPWAQAPGGGKLAALLVVFMLLAIPILPRAATIPFRSNFRSLSYYTRSARILR
jgi:hypothetical protein